MSKKKKNHIPENYEDLLKIWQGPNLDGQNIDFKRKRAYLSQINQAVISPMLEDHVKKMFVPFCNLEKIKETNTKTFDFKNNRRKLLVEVKTLYVDESHWRLKALNKDDVLLKIKSKIDLILGKDDSKFSDYRKGGAIVYTILFDRVSRISELLNETMSKNNNIFDNSLDFLAFLPQPATEENYKVSIDRVTHTPILVLQPRIKNPVIYVKNKSLYEEFKEAFPDSDCKLIFID